LNWAICKNTWKRCKANKLRMWLLVVFILKPILISTALMCLKKEFPDDLFSLPGDSVYLALICSSGVIGSQLSDGTLSLALSRPVSIASYVFSKWFAIAVFSSIATILQLLCELIMALSRTPAAINYLDVAINGAERIIFCVGFTAVMILLSAIVSGIKDLGLFVVLSVTSGICSMLAQIKVSSVPEGLARIAVSAVIPITQQAEVVFHALLEPLIDLSPLLSGNSISLNAITSYLAVITVCLSLAIFSLNRKELPYGAD
jgi:ABC-type transport system involved in multi-copper enzyme maturation permease subunit